MGKYILSNKVRLNYIWVRKNKHAFTSNDYSIYVHEKINKRLLKIQDDHLEINIRLTWGSVFVYVSSVLRISQQVGKLNHVKVQEGCRSEWFTWVDLICLMHFKTFSRRILKKLPFLRIYIHMFWKMARINVLSSLLPTKKYMHLIICIYMYMLNIWVNVYKSYQ